ncbi:MAG: bifunctional adenosylcobinamide kinase/adenosylcobinamide-phosphate guanylyltransferase [Terracidiphilus sp.]
MAGAPVSGDVKLPEWMNPAVRGVAALFDQRNGVQQMDRKTVTLVLGGVRSGKSRWAQQLASLSGRVAYVATAEAVDEEMSEKIRRHRQDRPSHWCTIEEPLELARVISGRAAEFDLLLVDCLTVYVSNLLWAAESDPASLVPRIEGLLEALRTVSVSVIVVSNEVGSGVVPEYPSGRKFRDALGELNQRVAALADNVVLMVAGLPLALKGSLGAVL